MYGYGCHGGYAAPYYGHGCHGYGNSFVLIIVLFILLIIIGAAYIN
ncbi:YjcZ family sporulation protein [Metabacillus sp. GX 13764]|nr:YjcZ family sporulation protein [Metabacillus kandeliae]MCD7033479.1 YjcZ family sporulation protein [Metabacillus kandeliae]